MTTTIDGFKPPEPEKVVCSDPKKLLAEIAAPAKMPPNFQNGVNIISSYMERVWEKSGCSCEPYREELMRLDKMRAEVSRKIVEIDQREHPDLDALAMRTKPWIPEWLREQVESKRISDRDLEYASGIDGEPYTKLFIKDIIAGWRPAAMRSNGGKA